MLMIPELRKVVIMLDTIPAAERDQVTLVMTTKMPNPHNPSLDVKARIANVTLSLNRLGVVITFGDKEAALDIPLDDVRSVWKSGDGWRVSVRGYIDSSRGAPVYAQDWR